MATNLVTQLSSILKINIAGPSCWEKSSRRHNHWFGPQAGPGKSEASVPSTVLGICAPLVFSVLEATQ